MANAIALVSFSQGGITMKICHLKLVRLPKQVILGRVLAFLQIWYYYGIIVLYLLSMQRILLSAHRRPSVTSVPVLFICGIQTYPSIPWLHHRCQIPLPILITHTSKLIVPIRIELLIYCYLSAARYLELNTYIAIAKMLINVDIH